MIISISKPDFLLVAEREELDLPKRWNGHDFHDELKLLFETYEFILSNYISRADIRKVRSICNGLLKCIEQYHNGFPYKAFRKMDDIMKKLMLYPVKIYKKSGWTDAFEQHDPLMLFRIRNVLNNTNYYRKDIFHTPYNLRSLISSFRYSISGYPSLYLSTSLELCCEESKVNSLDDLTIASRFKIERNLHNNNGMEIDVIELAVKLKDFVNNYRDINENMRASNTIFKKRTFNEVDLSNIDVMSSYLYWYPLIAACSFIRVNKNYPFASEYIIPQLLMQWIRSQFKNQKLIGIRYFSCASESASELGFNYIFPASGEKDSKYKEYCEILSRSFTLTDPIFIHEFFSVEYCERILKLATNFHKI